jgi:glycosyltransferase involved in cell wall biosynthesis
MKRLPKILHICNDYAGSLVHKNLYMRLDEMGVQQTIFVPLRDRNKVGSNSFTFKSFGSTIIHSNVLSRYHRVLFRSKITSLVDDLLAINNISEIDLVHATTLFSDGAVALKLFHIYKKPFIVTVRNTDIYTFLKYRPDLYSLAHDILSKASKIIFISTSLKNSFYSHFLIRSKRLRYLAKSTVICNGVEDFWLENLNFVKVLNQKILYIGRFDKNKNVTRLIIALELIRSEFPDISLTLVGGNGDRHEEVIKLIKEKKWIQYVGPVYDKEQLKEIFNSHSIFAMTSLHETFGLVYIEALSQGLPVLLTRGQGIDGLFSEKIGEAVNPVSTMEIGNGIKKMINYYEEYQVNSLDFSKFNWSHISRTYLSLYMDVLSL